MNQMMKVHASLFSGFGAAELAATWMGWNNAFLVRNRRFPQNCTKLLVPSIKGYGNTIVPEVIYEIFKAIEEVETINV